MTGPGVKTVTAFCPDCLAEVVCQVLVYESGETTTLNGPDEHRRVCPKRRT